MQCFGKMVGPIRLKMIATIRVDVIARISEGLARVGDSVALIAGIRYSHALGTRVRTTLHYRRRNEHRCVQSDSFA